jgi:hypothetical protein
MRQAQVAVAEPAPPANRPAQTTATLEVETDRVSVEEAREAGPVHVGHQIWQPLRLNDLLKAAGLSDRAYQLSEVMTLNRLIFPLAEPAMPDWIGRTALSDILGADFSTLSDEALYCNLDRLHPNREVIERDLAERPIFHQIERRTPTHIFLCLLAYHLLVAMERRFLDAGVHTSWWTLREQLSTHQVVTVVLPTRGGKTLKIRKGTTAEAVHREIYSTLKIPAEVMRAKRTWHDPPIVTE